MIGLPACAGCSGVERLLSRQLEWSQMSRITVGQITRVRGVKGELVVVPLTDDPSRFLQLQTVTVTKEEESRRFPIEGVRQFRAKVLLKLKEVDTPEQAQKLVGGFLEIEREQLVRLPEGRYFVFDIVGLKVVTTQGQVIGKIKEVVSLPGNDLYVVEAKGREYDIPAIKDVVKKIDLAKREMIIELAPGLLDI
jgi:16S rRNA processing protein RimM